MDRQLAACKLSSRDVAGDGNCLFRALSVCLYDKEDEHCNLRQNIVQHIYTLAALGDSLPGVSMDVTDKVVSKQLNEMKKDGCWAGEDIIPVAASYLQRVIHVYTFTTKSSSSSLVYIPN